IEAGLEPATPLLRGPMRERLGNHVALGTLLNLIISDRCGGAQPFLRVARIEKVALLREESPHARIAVGLELEAHRQIVSSPRARSLRLRVELSHRSQQVLHVVTDLVRDHVRLREIAWRAEPIVELAKKRCIEIQRAIARAVERS